MDLQQQTWNEAEQYAHISEQDFGADSETHLIETQLFSKCYSIIQKSERKGSKEAADFHAPVKGKTPLA